MLNYVKEENYIRSLRKKAELLVCESKNNLENLTAQEIKSLVDELQLHKIELKMQNDELRRANNEVEISKKHYLELYDNAPVGYMILDSNYVIIQTNLTALKLFEIDSKNILNEKIQKFIYKDDQDIFYMFHKELTKSEGKYDCQLRLLKGDGSDFWAYMKASLEKNELGEYIFKVIIEDITQRKELEDELKVKNNIMLSQARQAALGEMIGNIAHQWRQPLNSIGAVMMKLELKCDDDGLCADDIEDAIYKTNSIITLMSRTIDDFRNFFSPNKEKHHFKIRKSIESIKALMLPLLYPNDIDLVVSGDQDIEIFGYSNELEQVLLNLVSNAKDAIIVNKIENGIINIDIKKENYNLNIVVKDNANGISENIIQKVFDPYFTTKFKSQGTGIGLHMSKMIIENNMNGDLSVKNHQNGALFSITIPIN